MLAAAHVRRFAPAADFHSFDRAHTHQRMSKNGVKLVKDRFSQPGGYSARFPAHYAAQRISGGTRRCCPLFPYGNHLFTECGIRSIRRSERIRGPIFRGGNSSQFRRTG